MTTTQTQSVADVLRAARKLIDTPEKWGQGRETTVHGGKKLCAGLAFQRVTNRREAEYDRALQLFEIAADIPRHLSIPRWNDSHLHSEVMQTFDKAIQLAEAESK